MPNASTPRPEIFNTIQARDFAVAAAAPSVWARLYANGALRKTLLLGVLAAAWEIYARTLDNPLLFPPLTATVAALARAVASGELPSAAVYTLSLLFKGYAAGLVIASRKLPAPSARDRQRSAAIGMRTSSPR